MRLTVARDSATELDLEVPAGGRLGDLRAPLAATSGWPELADPSIALAVDAVVVDDDQLTSQVPLLAGATLRVGRGTVPADRAALDAHWHVAVLSGPDCGALRGIGAPGSRDRVVVGRDLEADLVIDDASISRRHLELSVRRSGPRVRDLGSSNGTSVLRASRRRPATSTSRNDRGARLPRGGRSVGLRDGDRLELGSTVLELRSRGLDRAERLLELGLSDSPAPLASRPARGWEPPYGQQRGDRARALVRWCGPAAGSLVLAVSMRNPLLLALALLGPVVAAVTMPRAHRRTRDVRAAADPPVALAPPASPGASSARAAPAGERPPPFCVPPADLATRALRTGAGGTATGSTPSGLRSIAPDGALAIVGPHGLAVAVARTLVLAQWPTAPGPSEPAPAPELDVRAAPARQDDWAWCRWLTSSASERAAGERLVVSDRSRDDGRAAALAQAWAGGEGATVLIVEPDRRRVPPWCRTLVEVVPGSATATLERPGRPPRPVPLQGVSVAWAESHARRVAGLVQTLGRRQPTTTPTASPPARVAFADLPGMPSATPHAVGSRWCATETMRAHGADGLEACLGLGPGGAPVVIDLARDGPHALVAGTTGAGKSELLQTLLLSLALTYSPADLAIALIDYKGGASFGACAHLPHVVGQVTDLDPLLAARALAGLQAELYRRERLLAAAGVGSLAALRSIRPRPDGSPHAPMPRLLVVVDEFRALTDDLPAMVPALLRLAAQGRSLGMHLVLATQRPAGAVGADLRANLALRIALRVTDAADSLDVIDVPDAARIPTGLPGRALVRRGAGPLEPVQVAHVDAAAADATGGVRVAPRWGSLATDGGSLATEGPEVAPEATRRPDLAGRADQTGRAFVDAATTAASSARIPRPDAPWLPPLPQLVRSGELGPRTPGLPLALADVPTERRRGVVGWDHGAGHLVVVGAPGSGRSTALRTLAAAALDRGWGVHAVGMPGRLLADLADHPNLGTVVGPEDPRRLARLVTLLLAGASGGDGAPPAQGPGTQVLLVDGLEGAFDALARVARGAGADRFVDLLRTGREGGVGVVATASSVGGPLAAHFAQRLVLALGDRTSDVLAGVPAELSGARRGPGRAIFLPSATSERARDEPDPDRAGPPAGPVLCQVAVADRRGTVHPGPVRGSGAAQRQAGLAPRLRALPIRARLADARALDVAAGSAVGAVVGPVVGIDGEDGGAVRLDLRRGALVVGPPGSGRSTALAVLAGALLEGSRPIAVVARDGPLRDLATSHAGVAVCGPEPGELARLLAGSPAGVVVLVDDLDALELQHPVSGDALAAVVATPADARGAVVVGSALTARAAVSYRGALGALRTLRTGIVLDPAEPGSAEVLGVGLEWVVDPARPHLPGRGARQHGSDVVALQVIDPTRD